MGATLCALPANAADITAEQSALLHDLLNPLIEMETPDGIDPDVYKEALKILQQERILLDGGRPNFLDEGLLDRYGKALFLGNRSREFAADIGHIHDLVARGNKTELKTALTDLWLKAGRARPDDKALEPVLDSLYETKGTQPQETINHVFDKPDHKIEIVHARAGGRMKVVVTDKNDDGGVEARTVFQGETETVPTNNGRELKREVKLKAVCTNTNESDAEQFNKLPDVWVSQNGDYWHLKGAEDELTFTQIEEDGSALDYVGQLSHGKIYAEHLITRADDINKDLPAAIRSEIAARADQTFRIHLEVCNDNTEEMQGTWSSQHVTYNPMFMSISKIHDPYDVALVLGRKPSEDEKVAEGAAEIEWP